MKIIYTIFLIALLNQALGQSNQIVLDSIPSKILNETRRFEIYLPQELIDKKQNQAYYPTLYVLDGADNSLSISGMMHYLSEVNGNRTLPKMIVVFIHNTNRTRDLTPYPAKASAILPEVMAKETGGAEKFTQFIEKELMPFIQNKYPCSEYRAIAGHSFGGIFALSVLRNHPEIFDDYLVMDPSLWYDEGRFSTSLLETFSTENLKKHNLFIAIANTTNEPNLHKMRKSKAAFSIHEKSILRFCEQLKNQKNIPFHFAYYSQDDHGSIPFIGIYDGLRFLFQNYQLSYYEVVDPMFDPQIRISSYYKNLSAKLKTPLQVSTAELEYFDLFYDINLDKKGQQKLRQYYQQLYPESFAKYLHSKVNN